MRRIALDLAMAMTAVTIVAAGSSAWRMLAPTGVQGERDAMVLARMGPVSSSEYRRDLADGRLTLAEVDALRLTAIRSGEVDAYIERTAR